jgi:hypothetical protein
VNYRLIMTLAIVTVAVLLAVRMLGTDGMRPLGKEVHHR